MSQVLVDHLQFLRALLSFTRELCSLFTLDSSLSHNSFPSYPKGAYQALVPSVTLLCSIISRETRDIPDRQLSILHQKSSPPRTTSGKPYMYFVQDYGFRAWPQRRSSRLIWIYSP